MLDVLSVGNANVDLMINSKRVVTATPVLMPGGSACNFAVGCSRLGLDAGYLGFIGDDDFGRIITGALKKEGVTSLAKIVKQMTGFVLVFTYKRFKKFIKHVGANENLKSLVLKPYLSKSRHLHLATPPLELLKQVPSGLSVSLDPGATISSFKLGDLAPYLKNVKVFIPNEEEALMITGRRDYHLAAFDLVNAGVEIVIIKLGKGGCYLATKDECTKFRNINFRVFDTTGAGDAFCSAFISAWLKGKTLSEACKWAIISSNVCVTKLGAQQSATIKELNEIYDKYYS